jgi:hypothetical protein
MQIFEEEKKVELRGGVKGRRMDLESKEDTGSRNVRRIKKEDTVKSTMHATSHKLQDHIRNTTGSIHHLFIRL